MERGRKRGNKKEIPAGPVNIKGHLRGHMETYYNRGLLKYIYIKTTTNKMESPRNRKDKVSSRPLDTKQNLQCMNGLYLAELMAKGGLWKPPENSSYCCVIGCSSQTASEALLLNITLTCMTEHEAVKLVSN